MGGDVLKESFYKLFMHLIFQKCLVICVNYSSSTSERFCV